MTCTCMVDHKTRACAMHDECWGCNTLQDTTQWRYDFDEDHSRKWWICDECCEEVAEI